jgi:hypothetical protein
VARQYLIYEGAISRPETRPVFEAVVKQISDGVAQVRKVSGDSYFKEFVINGQRVIDTAPLEPEDLRPLYKAVLQLQ